MMSDSVLARFRRTIGAGDHSVADRIYAADALFDVNVPQWRFQLRGPDSIRRQLDEWHPQPPDLVEWHQRPIDGGAVVELALWQGEGHELYSRSLHLLDIGDGLITRHVMYCTGDWTKQALYEATVTLLDTR